MRDEGRLAGAAGKASVNARVVGGYRVSAAFAWDPAQGRLSTTEQYRHTAIQSDRLAFKSVSEDNAATLRNSPKEGRINYCGNKRHPVTGVDRIRGDAQRGARLIEVIPDRSATLCLA
jgi:hypothetical protein